MRAHGTAILACSALKRAYRERLATAAGLPVRFIHLGGSREVLAVRLARRADHFMPASLVNAIQFLFWEWAYKPFGAISYGGISAGLRGYQELKVLGVAMKMVPVIDGPVIPFALTMIKDGVFEPTPIVAETLPFHLDELHRWTEALMPLQARVPELRKLLGHDASIKLVVLAAASGPGGPGPLVAQLGKREGLGPRPVPVLVVPGALSREDIRKLALPLAEALPHAADAHADPEPPPA